MSFLTTNSQFRLALVGICVVAITGGLGRFAYTPIIPYMQNTLNISSADIGLIASSNYLGYLIGSIIPLIYSLQTNKGSHFIYLLWFPLSHWALWVQLAIFTYLFY